ISIGTPSRPSALFTRQTGKVETQPTPSCLRMRLMPAATSIVMDVVSLAWSRAVTLRERIEAYNDPPRAVSQLSDAEHQSSAAEDRFQPTTTAQPWRR